MLTNFPRLSSLLAFGVLIIIILILFLLIFLFTRLWWVCLWLCHPVKGGLIIIILILFLIIFMLLFMFLFLFTLLSWEPFLDCIKNNSMLRNCHSHWQASSLSAIQIILITNPPLPQKPHKLFPLLHQVIPVRTRRLLRR